MHSTETLRSSSVINVNKWEIDTRRVAVGAKCTSNLDFINWLQYSLANFWYVVL